MHRDKGDPQDMYEQEKVVYRSGDEALLIFVLSLRAPKPHSSWVIRQMSHFEQVLPQYHMGQANHS